MTEAGVTEAGRLAAWDPAALGSLPLAVAAGAARFAECATELAAVGEALFAAGGGDGGDGGDALGLFAAYSWRGLAAQASSDVVATLVDVLREAARGADDIACATASASTWGNAGAPDVATAVQHLRERMAAAAIVGAPTTIDAAIEWLIARRAVDDAATGVLAADAAAARRLADAAVAVHALLRRWRPAALRELLAEDGFCAIVPLPGSDPELVADWWAGRTPEDRSALLLSRPANLGALDGLPADVRDTANRASLLGILSSYADTRRALADRLRRALAARDPQRLWDTVAALRALDARHAFAQTVSETLSAYAGRTDAAGAPVPVRLLLSDPDAFGGHGRAAVAFGDVDRAAHVAFVVPGFRQRVVPEFWRSSSDAWRLYAAADAGGAGGGVAAVSWFGYDVPMAADVALEGDARAGAVRLAGAVRGVRAARREGTEPHVTVVAHSYGSTTAGVMLRDHPGAGVDDLVALGSPGLGVPSVANLHLSPEHVWVGAASGDAVDHLGRFGADPASAAFGALRFDAETSHRSWWNPFEEHSHYFDEGEASLANVAAIVSGRPADVGTVAARRDGPWADAA